MTDLQAFRAGFAEGWAAAPPQRVGPVYDRAYQRGVEARERHENGGETMPAREKGQR